ncbi:hypothetical protein [Thalassiella azotivora]
MTDTAQDPPRLPVRTGLALLALLGAGVVLGEVDRLVTGAITPRGESRSLTDLVGPLAVAGDGRAWAVWQASEWTGTVAAAVLAHVVADVVLVLAYWTLLRRRVAASRVARRALVVLVGFEVAEAVGLLTGAAALLAGGTAPWLRLPLASATSGKWAAVTVLVVAAFRHDGLRGRAAGALRSGARAVWYQRLSLLVVLVLTVLSIVPLPDIWDQLPDVQRRWADPDPQSRRHLVVALALMVLVTGQLLVLGRLRAERAWATHVLRRPTEPAPPSRWWLVGPALVLVGAAALAATAGRHLVDAQLLVVPVVLPVALWATSWALHRWRPPRPVPPRRVRDLGRARRVWWLGDLLAACVPAAAGLGLLRSFTAPVVTGPEGDWGSWSLQLLLWGTGAALAALSLPAVRRLMSWVDRRTPADAGPDAEVPTGPVATAVRVLRPDRPRDRPRTGVLRGLPLTLWLLALAVLVAILLWPSTLPPWLGVVGTVEAVIGAWVVIVGYLQVHLQHQQPLAVFRLLRLEANPVIALLLTVPLVNSLFGGDPDLHAVRALPLPPGAVHGVQDPRLVDDRPALTEVVDDWVARSGACDRTVTTPAGPVTVRPMVVVAAQGGGIRATTWTAAALARLRAEGPCATHAVALSSGVSGGSVGLALGRGDEPVSAARDLAAPDALASAIAGLLVGDTLGGGAGLRVPGLDGDGRWLDRAGLIETTWEEQAPGLSDPFTADVDGAGGALVLSSAAAGLGCRVLVSQADVRTPERVRADALVVDVAGRGQPRCRALTGLPPATLDLRTTYGVCAPHVTWATASMLSARFPTVTPAGRVPPTEQVLPDGPVLDCSRRPDMQLVDGGYAEGSGVGTLADLAPDLLDAVRAHNVRALAADGPVVVPVVVYLQNANRADLAVPAADLAPEPLVPAAGLRARDLQVDDATWLQRAAGALADPCPAPVLAAPVQEGRGAAARCDAAVRELRDQLPGGVVVVAPRTRPAVEPPLGWTLSATSQQRLLAAMDDQAVRCSGPRPGGYSCLRDLLEVLEPDRRRP